MSLVVLDVLELVQNAMAEFAVDSITSHKGHADLLKTSADELRRLLDSHAALVEFLEFAQRQAATSSGSDECLPQARAWKSLIGAFHGIRGSCIALRTILNEANSRDLPTEALQSYTADVDLHPGLLVNLPTLLLPDGNLSEYAKQICWADGLRPFERPRLEAFAALLQRLERCRAELLNIELLLRTKAADIEAKLVPQQIRDA